MSPSSPIVVLDSGLGGLTVARAITSLLPTEEIVYFGDTARLPYGSKSAATVSGFVKQIIAYLRPLHPKHIVIACNTATALALPAIRQEFSSLSISGVIDPGARAAASAAGTKLRPIIGVIATEATIRSKAYNRAIHRRRNHALLMMQAAPLLAPIIEEGRRVGDPLVRLALQQYISPLVKRQMDVLVLGCTHYPILASLIAEIVGPTVRVIDSAEQCAQDVAARLRARGLLRASGKNRPGMRCFVTDDPERFVSLGSRFLGVPIDPPHLVSIDRLAESMRDFQQESARLAARAMQIRRPALRPVQRTLALPPSTGMVA